MATANTNLSNYDKTALPNSADFKIGIVVSEWNSEVTDGLLEGALHTLVECGVSKENITVYKVPGSFELIYAAKKVQSSGVDAVITIGCVIQGETKHFDYVCAGVTQGVKDLNIQNDVPVIFCVLTDNNKQQSLDRSGGKHGNKGVEAAITALKMIDFNRSV
ncbi:6,7-dimethyl-8-ribityllumazine synthase [Flavobacteriaceae bacterium]|jgi:6,7-dimethyl-8-ribityllumazine synthase|nr:6,7-dimethyl-8-ribityllumazine synthase [Flavobacteriaceae bacterium]MDB2631373.1 6,7-dimethyl-8-ribityllumazine synthase [Flavobacteriaceae bacterium]